MSTVTDLLFSKRAWVAAALGALCSWSSAAVAQPSLVHLTFDDGPHGSNTPRLLDLLKQHRLKATFYVTGQNVRSHPAVIKRIVMEGHSLGNHTYDHKNLKSLSVAQIHQQLDDTQLAVDEALGVRPGRHYPIRTVRPPYGAVNDTVREVIASRLTPAGKVLQAKGRLPEGAGRTRTVLWNVDSEDWRRQGTETVMSHVFPAVDQRPSRDKTLLFHDIHTTTVNEYFPAVLTQLLADGHPIERLDKVKGYIGTPSPEPSPAPADTTSAVAGPSQSPVGYPPGL